MIDVGRDAYTPGPMDPICTAQSMRVNTHKQPQHTYTYTHTHSLTHSHTHTHIAPLEEAWLRLENAACGPWIRRGGPRRRQPLLPLLNRASQMPPQGRHAVKSHTHTQTHTQTHTHTHTHTAKFSVI